jgi:3-phytase
MEKRIIIMFLTALCFGCASRDLDSSHSSLTVQPALVTQQVNFDSDDPAIWINHTDPDRSLVIGTDKNKEGALFVFDLSGNIVEGKVVRNLNRPNNVDVEYGLMLDGRPVDIAVTTERLTEKLRIFSLPEMTAVDNGGVQVFTGENEAEHRAPMGIALYKRPSDGCVFAIVSRKSGPREGYLWQYLLEDDGKGKIKGTFVRAFGRFSGSKEIEAVAVDDALGHVYYSDESVGVRKYYADPKQGDEELALFGTEGFKEDREGICIYTGEEDSGYIVVSDQGAGEFHIFQRTSNIGNRHAHPLVRVVKVAARESDGCDLVSVGLNDMFSKGLFVAMSDDRTYHYYRWEDITGTK